jgi:hypothetical protein
MQRSDLERTGRIRCKMQLLWDSALRNERRERDKSVEYEGECEMKEYKNPCKSLKADCVTLGSKYCIRFIDDEWCLYRDFGDGCYAEISGLNHNRAERKATVYIWKIYGDYYDFKYRAPQYRTIQYKFGAFRCCAAEYNVDIEQVDSTVNRLHDSVMEENENG